MWRGESIETELCKKCKQTIIFLWRRKKVAVFSLHNSQRHKPIQCVSKWVKGMSLNYPPKIFLVNGFQMLASVRVHFGCWLCLKHTATPPGRRYLNTISSPISAAYCKENNSCWLQQEITIWLYEAPLPDSPRWKGFARFRGSASHSHFPPLTTPPGKTWGGTGTWHTPEYETLIEGTLSPC